MAAARERVPFKAGLVFSVCCLHFSGVTDQAVDDGGDACREAEDPAVCVAFFKEEKYVWHFNFLKTSYNLLRLAHSQCKTRGRSIPQK